MHSSIRLFYLLKRQSIALFIVFALGLGACSNMPSQSSNGRNTLEGTSEALNSEADWTQIEAADHSATDVVSSTLSRILELSDEEGKQVAVLLPLTGELFSAGESVKEGILQAYYEEGIAFKLQFYDTHDRDIDAVYSDALKNNANVVIGPLQKSKVAAIQYDLELLNVPLNSTEKSWNVSPLDVTVESEIEQLSQIIQERGYCRVIFVSLEGERERRIGALLGQHIHNNGGMLKEQIFLPKNQINNATKSLKGVLQATEVLEVFENGVFIGWEEDDYPFVRQDIDIIVSHLPLVESRLYVPLFRSIGGELPVLSTSEMAAEGRDRISRDADLIGIEFLDLPVLNKVGERRLFEDIGFDALKLSNILRYSKTFRFQGRTGSYIFEDAEGHRFLDIYQVTEEGLNVKKFMIQL